ncbi:hypothetical protein HispidOSU_009801, partial [Sigmodon hispidus]
MASLCETFLQLLGNVEELLLLLKLKKIYMNVEQYQLACGGTHMRSTKKEPVPGRTLKKNSENNKKAKRTL